jgi:biopolymer transport protein ExbB/TolQ
MNLLEAIFQREIISYGMVLTALALCYVAVERFLLLRTAGVGLTEFMASACMLIKKKDVEGVLLISSKDGNVAMRIVRKGVFQFSRGLDYVQRAIDEAVEAEKYRLSRRHALLLAGAVVSPGIGLLSTVVEFRSAFLLFPLSTTRALSYEFSAPLARALEPFAFGIAVGVFAAIVFAILTSKLGTVVFQAKSAGSELLDMLRDQVHVQAPLPVLGGKSATHASSTTPRTIVFEDDFYGREGAAD